MAIFGDLGKALGLGSGEDLLPIIGTAAGFYFGGPVGASIGSGIGSLAGGKSVNDALTNAALAYGVTSFVSPNMNGFGFGNHVITRPKIGKSCKGRLSA